MFLEYPNVFFIVCKDCNACQVHTFREVDHMKQRLCLLLAALLLISTLPVLAEESNIFDSAGKFLGDTWNSVSDAASDAWENVGETIGQAWDDVSGFAADAWNDVGAFLGEKNAEFSVWMSITGNDALEKLKGIYDEMAAEMLIEETSANDLWLRSMDYAQANGIAKVTQAKLTLAALAYAQSADVEGDVAQAALDMLLNSGITDQAAAETALASMTAAGVAAPDPNEPRYYLAKRSTPVKTTAIPKPMQLTAGILISVGRSAVFLCAGIPAFMRMKMESPYSSKRSAIRFNSGLNWNRISTA